MRVLQLQTLVGILAQHDPEGLVQLGAPRDEYEPEARDLATQLVPVTTLEECTVVAERVWQHYFARISTSCRQRLQLVIKDIWHLAGLPS